MTHLGAFICWAPCEMRGPQENGGQAPNTVKGVMNVLFLAACGYRGS